MCRTISSCLGVSVMLPGNQPVDTQRNVTTLVQKGERKEENVKEIVWHITRNKNHKLMFLHNFCTDYTNKIYNICELLGRFCYI